jgi:hypothetical protein
MHQGFEPGLLIIRSWGGGQLSLGLPVSTENYVRDICFNVITYDIDPRFRGSLLD